MKGVALDYLEQEPIKLAQLIHCRSDLKFKKEVKGEEEEEKEDNALQKRIQGRE